MELAETNKSSKYGKQQSIEEYLGELKDFILIYEQETNSETKLKVNEACATLIQLLPSNSESVQLSILKIITDIKNENVETFKELFIENNVMFVLVDLLYSSDSKIKEYSYQFLRDWLKDRTVLALEDDTLKLVPKLAAVLSPTTTTNNSKQGRGSDVMLVITKTQVYALQLILLVSFKKDSFLVFKKCHVLPLLRPYLSIHNYLIKQKACEVLINMTYEETGAIRDIFECKFLDHLVTILAIDSTSELQIQDGVNVQSLQLCALCVIANITRGTSEQNSIIVNSGILKYLLPFLTSNDPKIRISTAAILSNLSRESPQVTETILSLNYLPVICRVVENPDESLQVKSHLVKFFANLARGSDTQRKIVANYKIISALEPILLSLNSKEFDSDQLDSYGSTLDICLYVVIYNKFQKKFFFEMNILNLLFPILTVGHNNESVSSLEKHVVLKKNFVKFLLLLSKNAREYNYEILVNCRVLEKLIQILNEITGNMDSDNFVSLDKSSASPYIYTKFGKPQSQIFDILTIIYSISINCKQDDIQKQILVQKFALFKLLLDYSEKRYNFKIRYISCELLTIMFKFDKDINNNSAIPKDANTSFFKLIDDDAILKIVNNFNKDNNGTEIDLQLVSIISYICLKDHNSESLTRWFELMLETKFLNKLLLLGENLNVNNQPDYPIFINIIIIFYSLFKLKNKNLMQLINKEQILQMLEFFKTLIGTLTTKKDDGSAKTNELAIGAITEFVNISVKEKQFLLNSGILGILALYLYSFSSVRYIRLLPLVLSAFAAIAAGNEQQKAILCSKYNILPLVLSIIMNNGELMNNIVVKKAAIIVLDNLTTNESVKVFDLVYKLGMINNLIEFLDERQFDTEFKSHAISTLANLAAGSEYQKEEQIAQGVLLPVFDIFLSLVKPTASATPHSNSSASPLPSPQSVKSASSKASLVVETNTKVFSAQLLKNVLRLISNLSSGDTKQSLQIINSGYLPLLFEVISTNDIIAVEKSCRIIRNVSNGGINHCRAIIANYLIIPLNSLLANNQRAVLKGREANSALEAVIASENETQGLKKSMDLSILWVFANVSRFKDSERLTVLNSGVLLTLPKLISLTNVTTKAEKNQQRAILSLLNNLIMSKECLSVIIYKHSELIVSIIDALLDYTEKTQGNGVATDSVRDLGDFDGSAETNDLVVLLLNFISQVSNVDDIKYRRFLIEQKLLVAVNQFVNSKTLVVKNLSKDIINNLKGFEKSRKKAPT